MGHPMIFGMHGGTDTGQLLFIRWCHVIFEDVMRDKWWDSLGNSFVLLVPV